MPYLNIHGWHELSIYWRMKFYSFIVLFIRSIPYSYAWMNQNSFKQNTRTSTLQMIRFLYTLNIKITSRFQIQKSSDTMIDHFWWICPEKLECFSIYLHNWNACIVMICDLESILRQKAVLKLQFWLLSPIEPFFKNTI